jgi:hypothetical protein
VIEKGELATVIVEIQEKEGSKEGRDKEGIASVEELSRV